MPASGVEYVVGTVHEVQLKFSSHVKQDFTGDFSAQRLDLASVIAYTQANIASHGRYERGTNRAGTTP